MSGQVNERQVELRQLLYPVIAGQMMCHPAERGGSLLPLCHSPEKVFLLQWRTRSERPAGVQLGHGRRSAMRVLGHILPLLAVTWC